MSQQKRLPQLSNIRALAILLVVLGHSIILYSSSWDLYETTVSVPFLDALKRIIDIPQMPLFFSLSGYLFAFRHQNRRSFRQLLKNKFLRLLVPYLGIGILYLLPIRLLVGFPSYQSMGVGEFLLKLLNSSDVGHLWYLPALFLVFLLSKLILTVTEKVPGIKRYPEIVLCVIAFGLYLEGYRIGFGYPPLLSAYNYLIWFSLGYFLHVHQELVRKVYSFPLVKWALLALNAALLVYCCLADSVRVILSLAVRALCIVNAYGAMPQRSCKLVEKIDRNSFGVYLFHSPLIYMTYANIPNANPVIVVLINFVIFGAIAFGLTEIVRKTRLKVLIGE